MSAPTPSEAVRVAVQECKRFAKAAMMGALNRPADRVSDPHDLLIQCFERIDALAALSLHVGDVSDVQSDALQPSPGERHALPRLQVPADEGLDTNERDGERQETPLTDLREVSTDQRPAAPPGAQEQAGAPAQPSPHIEPVAGSPAAQFHRNFVASRRSIKRERGAAPSDAALSPTEEEPLSPTSEVLSALGMTREVCSLALAVLGSIHPEGTDPYVMEAERRIRAIESKVRAGTLTGPEGAS